MRNSRCHELKKRGGQGAALMNVEEQQRKAKHVKGFTPGNDPKTEKNDKIRSASPREINHADGGETPAALRNADRYVLLYLYALYVCCMGITYISLYGMDFHRKSKRLHYSTVVKQYQVKYKPCCNGAFFSRKLPYYYLYSILYG